MGINRDESSAKTIAFSIALTVAFVCVLAACGLQTTGSKQETTQSDVATAVASHQMSDEAIIDSVVNNFMLISEIPRPSHHEKRVGTFLKDWAIEHGFNPVQDSVGNVMFDAPATLGMENIPLTILQAHMDMMAVADDGITFDPVNDKIAVVRDDGRGTLTADGTSLGADDGVGLAMATRASRSTRVGSTASLGWGRSSGV